MRNACRWMSVVITTIISFFEESVTLFQKPLEKSLTVIMLVLQRIRLQRERERLRVLWEKRNNNRRREKVVRAWGTLPCQAPNGTTTNTFLSSSLLFPYQTCVLVLSSPNTMPVLLNVTILFSKLHSSFTPLLIYLVLHFNFFYPKYQHI